MGARQCRFPRSRKLAAQNSKALTQEKAGDGSVRRCQSKIDHFARASETYFATVDFPGFFWIKRGGSTPF